MEHLICNRCGKKLRMEKDILQEDYMVIRKDWGYFSKKDGKTQQFLLCEDCVEQIAQEFVIPSVLENTTELL